MRRQWTALVMVVLLGLAASPAGMLASAQDGTEPDCPDCGEEVPGAKYVPDELLVRFRPAVSKARALQVVSEEGAEHGRGIPALGVQVLRLPPGLSVQQAVVRFNRRPEVDYAEPNYILQIAQSPDPGLANNQWAPQKIGAPEAWDSTTRGDPAVVIAIVDTGIDYQHPELAPNMWKNLGEIADNALDDDQNGCVDDVGGCDFVNGDGDPMDDHSHGTHVAGIAAADENDIDAGLVGICPNCTLMPVKVMSAQGSGTEADVAEGIAYAADNGAKVINLSMRFATTGGEPITLRNAVDYAWGQGAVVAAATGNEGLASNDPYQFYPAAHANAIGVAATDQEDLRSCYSNKGSDLVSVAAPGDEIHSALPLWADDDYGLASGTSMATPHVSGLAGLLFSHYPGEDNAFVRARIEDSADYFGPGESDASLGTGRINAYAALTGANPSTGLPPGLMSTWNTASGYANSRKLVRDTTGTLHLAWHSKEGSNYQVLYVTSVDDGANWSAPKVVFSSTAETWHPTLALDGDYVYFAFATKHGASTYRTFFRRLDRSTDAWDDAVALTESGYDAVRPDLYLDPANGWLHMVASSFTNAPYVYYRASSEQGDTWEPLHQVDLNDPDSPVCEGDTRYATVHAYGTPNSGGNVYIAGRTLKESCNILWCEYLYCTQTARSTDGGANWPTEYREKLASWNAINTAEYGLSLAGVGDRLYLSYEVGSGNGGGLYFRRWDGTSWSGYVQLESTGLWPTITQADDGQAWMMWEDAGSLKMRHYDGFNWDPAETLLEASTHHKGYYPNLKLGTAGGRLDWVYTSCKGLPYSLAVGSRLVSADAPPAVRIDDPVEAQPVAGVYTIRVHASDDSAVGTVELSIDGGLYQEITANFDGTHYTDDWDTTDGYSDGAHTLQARATDDAPQTTTSVVRNVTVDNQNGPPVAAFTVNCTGLVCDFNASSSYDPDGTVSAYVWDFGDGNTDTGVAPSHIYAGGGTYTVALTVTDNEGAISAVIQDVIVEGGGAAQAVHVGDLDGTKTSTQKTWLATVTIEVHDGSHILVDEAIVSGVWSYGSGTSVSCQTGGIDGTGRCTIERQGIPKKVSSVVFTVTDVTKDGHTYADGDNHEDEGDSNGTSIVVPPPANQPPVASFTYACTDLSCDFDAAGSNDPDGSIIGYEWDFGDGDTATVVAPSHTYARDGTYLVVLVVTDGLGATGTESQSVTVPTGGGGDTMHVGLLQENGVDGRRNRWNATVTVTIHDGAEAGLADATVTGTWSDGATGTAECTTGVNGECDVTKANLKLSVPSVTFTVNSVTHATHSYAPLENHDPGDPEPSIVVSSP